MEDKQENIGIEKSTKESLTKPQPSLPSTSAATGLMALNNTKAGMEGIDTERINLMIQEASGSSKYSIHKKGEQEKLDKRVAGMKNLLQLMSEAEMAKARKQVNATAREMERGRNMSRVIVHVDMDAFFASVEMRDNPSLKDKPMAVGNLSMLSTSNYIARRYGVRAAMPGFMGKKLCPELIIVPCNFSKYIEVSAEVEDILKDYDPDVSMSMDEAYLDITAYLENSNILTSESSQLTALEAVKEMRQRIFEKTQLTASAGIAPNELLAKIAGDICKPNNQYYLEPTIEAVEAFIKPLPIRKICGIGPVTEQLLKGLDIHTCSDLWKKREVFCLLFKPSTAHFLLSVSMGLGSSFSFHHSSMRKSMSCERTFSGTSDEDELRNWCQELCHEIERGLQDTNILCKAVTLKIKTVDFVVKTRVRSLADYTDDASIIFEAAWSIYATYLRETKKLTLRLMGVKASIFKYNQGEEVVTSSTPVTKQKRIDHLFAEMQQKTEAESSKEYECPICKKQFCSVKAVESHVDNCLKNFGANENTKDMAQEAGDAIHEENEHDGSQHKKTTSSDEKILCPICRCEIMCTSEADVAAKVNNHIDACLSKDVVQEIWNENKSNDNHAPKIIFSSDIPDSTAPDGPTCSKRLCSDDKQSTIGMKERK